LVRAGVYPGRTVRQEQAEAPEGQVESSGVKLSIHGRLALDLDRLKANPAALPPRIIYKKE
ncbi:MAG TPA: hypothetical protein VFK30_14260, partial [Anaerolineae bacterium]|nr:hypothetical protein [Anaerolineae bacterium]